MEERGRDGDLQRSRERKRELNRFTKAENTHTERYTYKSKYRPGGRQAVRKEGTYHLQQERGRREGRRGKTERAKGKLEKGNGQDAEDRAAEDGQTEAGGLPGPGAGQQGKGQPQKRPGPAGPATHAAPDFLKA